MKRYIIFSALVMLSLAGHLHAEESLTLQVKETVKNSTLFMRSISTNGGYTGIYSLDLKTRYGEATYEKAKLTEIWVQPPGTPSVGLCFLRAYHITGDSEYLDAAREVGRALAWGQRLEGGWDHRVDVSHLHPGYVMPERKSGRCTMDDNISQGALNFLFELDKDIDEEWLSESIELGLNFILQSQFDNGAWPQWYPLIGGYHDYYTFNDNTINDCIKLMIKAHRLYGKDEYRGSVRRGGDFIILSQIPKPHAGWAQQYSHDLRPAWARKYEPPAVCSAVTARNIRTLVDISLYTKEKKYLAPIPGAIEWLDKSKIGDNLWARMYEVGTNKPIYGDHDGKIHYTFEEISEERKSGYSWQSGFGVKGAVEYYNEVKKSGIEKYAAAKSLPLTPGQRRKKLEQLAQPVKEIIAGLDEKGRWINQENNMIYARDFVGNFNRLCEYLETAE